MRSEEIAPSLGRVGVNDDPLRPLVDIDHLAVSFPTSSGDILAVRDVSLSVPRGGKLVILGESGSGKSVTLQTLLGTHPRQTRISGSVKFDGVELVSMPPRRAAALRGRHMGFVPQSPIHAFDPLRPIGTQLVELLRTHDMVAGRRDGQARALELYDLVGLPAPRQVAERYPHELSGGMCQRAAIAMAIAAQPSVLLCDEPTTALDVSVQAQILDLFEQLVVEFSMAFLLVTHDVEVAADLGGQLAVMYAGRVVESGGTRSVIADPKHPYLRGLLNSRPTPQRRRGSLVPIPGQPPSPAEVGVGCAFAPRCPDAIERCQVERPEFRQVVPGHGAACLRLIKEGDGLVTAGS